MFLSDCSPPARWHQVEVTRSRISNDGATTDEKNKILHLLFEAIYYDFDQKRMVRFKPLSEYAPIFQLAAPFSGWTEKEGFVFSTSDEIIDM